MGWVEGVGCEAVLVGCSGSDKRDNSFMEPVKFPEGGEVGFAAGDGDCAVGAARC